MISKPRLISVAVALALATGSAHAVLERVGPSGTSPTQGGYPIWYQDTTGLALEFCDPRNQAELDGGWCLLLPGDVQAIPEVFPTNFFDEHFWFAAGASATPANGGRALLTLAVEAAFAADVAPGGQIAFSRIRVVLNPVPASGTYRIIHPYGEEIVEAQAGERIFITDDVGINCAPGQFDCATQSRLGPFLLPADVPGGAEQPAVAGPVSGKLYITDPARSGPVTGSALPDFVDSTGALRNHNIFRIEGPVGSGLGVDPVTGASVDYVETTDFSLMGRVFTEAIPGRVTGERATYERAAGGDPRLDVFASAAPTTQGRRPTEPRPPLVAPQLTFFDAPCAGQVDADGNVHPPYSAPAGANEYQMFSQDSAHWGQASLPAVPASVCVKDASARNAAGQIVPTYTPLSVTDDVSITQAYFNASTGTLNVSASSSDAGSPPALRVAFGTYLGDLSAGQHDVPGLVAPPAKVRVLSSAGGVGEAYVRTGVSGTAPDSGGGAPVAYNDTFALSEDAPTQTLAVLSNDHSAAGGTVSITAAPRLGTAIANADGTISFTPNLNASGLDGFTYTVSVGGQTSNSGNVTLDIAPVNDAPVAAADSANAIANVPVSISVLANDSDVDGAADLVAAVNVGTPMPSATTTGAATATANAATVSFSATAAGTYTFTYQAQDATGATSDPATVTVQVAGAETIAIVRAEYVLSKSRLRTEGTISPAASQTVSIDFVSSAGIVLGNAGSTVADAAGNWALDKVVALPTGTTSIRATSSNGTVRTSVLVAK